MGPLRPWHIIILVVVLVLLFGAKRLPNAARSLGRSMRIMKAETRGLVDEPDPDDLDEKADAPAARQPLSKADSTNTSDTKSAKDTKGTKEQAQSGEVVDPVERVRES